MHVYVLLYVSYCSSCHVSRQIALSCNFQVLCSRRHGLEVLPWIFWERLSRKPVIFRLVLCTCVAAWQNKMLQSQCACSFLPAENYVRRMSCLSLSILSWETPAAFNGTLRAWQSQCFRNIDIERSGGKTCFAWVRGCSVGHCKAGKQMEIALYAYDFFHLLILTGRAWPIAYGKVKLASFVGRNWTWMVTICWPTQEKGQVGVDSAQLIMSRPESSNRPNSGSGSRPGSRSALGVAGASISVKESLEILQNASKSSEKETEVLKEARAAVASMKETTEKLEKTVVEAESACKTHSSLDAKWEEFKAKFDALNRMAVEKIMGLGGSSTSDLRPASRISSARVAQVLRRSQNLVVLTGAGISAESGIPTFRGADGFWTVGSKHYQPQELATWEKYNEMPAELWRWYQYRWGICRKAKTKSRSYCYSGTAESCGGQFHFGDTKCWWFAFTSRYRSKQTVRDPWPNRRNALRRAAWRVMFV